MFSKRNRSSVSIGRRRGDVSHSTEAIACCVHKSFSAIEASMPHLTEYKKWPIVGACMGKATPVRKKTV